MGFDCILLSVTRRRQSGNTPSVNRKRGRARRHKRRRCEQKRAQGERGPAITEIAAPQLNERLIFRCVGNGAKGLVSPERQVIACLAPGDEIWLWNMSRRFERVWGIRQTSKRAVFFMRDGKDYLLFENGVEIPLRQMNRETLVKVAYVTPRGEEKIVDVRPRKQAYQAPRPNYRIRAYF